MHQDALKFYSGKKEEFSRKLKTVSKLLNRFVWYRSFSFILIFVPVSVLGFEWMTLLLSVVAIILFFFFTRDQ